ncbi:hypothetical protein KI387_027798, partial [Taxus chinensis]
AISFFGRPAMDKLGQLQVFCCDQCIHKSRAAYYPFSQPVKAQACGYDKLTSPRKHSTYMLMHIVVRPL